MADPRAISTPAVTTRVLIIADDLTGALDSAAAFAVRGLSVRVATGPEHLDAALSDASVQAVSVTTSTREGDAETAARVIKGLGARISDFDGLVFKKMDSRLKGHIGVELAALTAQRPGPVLACPAIPRLGRLVSAGAVTGTGVIAPIPIAPLLGQGARVVNAQTDKDLDRALPAALGGTLYLGAAGLAEALARRLAPDPVAGRDMTLPLPLLLAIGSRDPITLAQVAGLGMKGAACPGGTVPAIAAKDVRLAQITSGQTPGAASEVGAKFADGVLREMVRNRPATLFACGGETAAALLRGLDIPLLDLLGEALPGVPVARCPATGLTVVTKSGGFGSAPLLKQLVNMFAKPR